MYLNNSIPEGISKEEIDKKFPLCNSILFQQGYQYNPVDEYDNEKIVKEAMRPKKKGFFGKDKTVEAENCFPPCYDWNFMLGNRVKSQMKDLVSETMSVVTGSQYNDFALSISKQASTDIVKDIEIAKAMRKAVVDLRKGKEYVQNKQPTPKSFWENEFNKHFKFFYEEAGESAALYMNNLKSGLDSLVMSKQEQLDVGNIPSDLQQYLENELNVLLRVQQKPVQRSDLDSGANCHPTIVNAMNEYSVGRMITVWKYLFYDLYNPGTGVFAKDSTTLLSSSAYDIKSFTEIILQRLYTQFTSIHTPCLASFIGSVVGNAVILASSPTITFIVNSQFQNEQFAYRVKLLAFAQLNEHGIEIYDFMCDDENRELQAYLKLIDLAKETLSPYKKLYLLTNAMSSYSFVLRMLKVKNIEMTSQEAVQLVVRYIILMYGDQFVLDFHLISLFVQCCSIPYSIENTYKYFQLELANLYKLIGLSVCFVCFVFSQ